MAFEQYAIEDLGVRARTRSAHVAQSDLARERARALVCRQLFGEASELLAVGRFELLRTLGRGGMGVVYEAVDPLRRERVALKMLHGRTPTHLYRCKREFRSLAALHHPNLVALHELSVSGDDAYFTMDLVAGRDFVAHLRGDGQPLQSAEDEARLRDALAQLCEGVHALHCGGKLHRDLKPSNVLVTRQGRVVLLDFGLVDDARDAQRQSHGQGAGTPAYMAPEQARGAACASSDWYGLGAILHEALRGSPAGQQRAPGLLELERLAEQLLQPDPTRRPGYGEIAAAVRGAPRSLARQPSLAGRSAGFVGREAELEQLAQAFARSRTGPCVLLVRGESGIGKSALLQRFVHGTLEPARALVLGGRCYERESLPYKALDSTVDELSRHLIALPDAHALRLRPDDASALLHIFPVLGRVPAFSRDAQRLDGLHPVELRRRGFAAFKALLHALAAERPLALCIDDLQWSDADSGQLLAALLCDEGAPPLLVVASDRSDPGTQNPAIEALRAAAELSPRPPAILELPLRALAPSEAAELAVALFEDGAVALDVAESVAAESRGNPLFLIELSRWLSASPGGLRGERERPSLDSLLGQRLAQLTQPGRLVLELVAAAGRPLPASVIAHAASLDGELYARLDELRAARLLHAVQRSDRELLEVDHDRVAESVLARVAGERRIALHLRLARAIEAQEGADSEALIEQYLAAQLPLEAASRARSGGDVAVSALAFSRAARLYQRALQLGAWSPREQLALECDLALALEHSGRSLESAAAYQRAAALAPDPLAAAQLEQHAAKHLMHNGRHLDGERLVQRGYASLGLHWPQGRAALALSILGLLLPPRLRRLGKRSSASDALRRARAEFLSGAGRGIENYDLLRALHNALLCCDQSEQLPDPVWQARARGARGLLRSLSPLPGDAARGLRELERACAAAAALSDLPALADLQRQLAFSHYVCGQPRAALDAALAAETTLSALPITTLDRYPVMGLIGSALLDLGELREARRRWTDFARAARQHGDLMTTLWIHAHPAQLAMLFAADERERAQAILEQLARLRALHPSYKALGFCHALSSGERELYWGTAQRAEQLIEREQRALFESGYPVLSEHAVGLRARVALACAAAQPEGRGRETRLRCAASAASALERRGTDLRRGNARLLRAGIAMLRGREDSALQQLELALASLDAAQAKLGAASARYCQGALLGGEQGRALQDAAARALQLEGIAQPARWVAWSACGFRNLFGAANDR